MLRIGAKNAIQLRKSEAYFSSDFIKGLLIALILHLLFFCLFRIASPPNTDLFSPIEPVAVEIDLGAPRVVLSPNQELTHSPLEELAPPQINFPPPQLVVDLHPIHKMEARAPDFSEIEKIDYQLLEDFEEEEEEDD